MAQWTKDIPTRPGFYWYRDNGETGILQLYKDGDWYAFGADESVHFGPPHPNVAHIFAGRREFNPEFWDEPMQPPAMNDSSSQDEWIWARLARKPLPEGHPDAVWDSGFGEWMESDEALKRRVEKEQL